MGQAALTAPARPPGPRGRFITFEGGEGTGKSTQTALLTQALRRAGIATRQTREPGGSAGAEAIRQLLLDGADERWDAIGEALLLNAARRDHILHTILPALTAGIWVVCDRFADSTLAYQGYGRGLPLAELKELQRFTVGELKPDLTFILDLSIEEGLRRAARRAGSGDRFERLNRGFHERLRRGFQEIAAADPQRCVAIDAAGDRDSVHCAVLDVVSQRFGIGFAA